MTKTLQLMKESGWSGRHVLSLFGVDLIVEPTLQWFDATVGDIGAGRVLAVSCFCFGFLTEGFDFQW